MKYLEIKDNKGFYWDGIIYQEIDKISKEALLKLLNFAEEDSFEMDKYQETLLANKAHQIIYENIYNKLNEFLANKDQFKNEVERLYKEAIGKYSVDITASSDVSELTEQQDSNAEDDLPF